MIRVAIDGAASQLDELCRDATDVTGVQFVSGWVEGEALATGSGQSAPVIVRGWRPNAIAELAGIMGPLISGSTFDLDKEGQALVGNTLAARLRTSLGETIRLTSPTSPMPTVVSATIAGVFQFRPERANEILLYVSAATARRLLSESLAHTIIQVFLAPSADVERVEQQLASVMPLGAMLSIEEG